VDPLAEKREWLSGYNYVQNNPILRIDPNGAIDDYYGMVNNTLQYLGSDGEGSAIRLVTEDRNAEATPLLNGATTTVEQRATLRDATSNLTREVTFNEGSIQTQLQNANDRTITSGVEQSVIITLNPTTATVDAVAGNSGTATTITNSYDQYGGGAGNWSNGNLAIGEAHTHPLQTNGTTNIPGYSATDSNTAGTAGMATYAVDSYSTTVGTAATIHRTQVGGTAGTNPIGTTQITNNIGRNSFLSTAIR
jgi:hypothetical protein